MDKRRVGYGILFNLLKERNPVAIVGLVFTSVSIVVLIPLFLILSTVFKHPYENYNFEAISKNGVEKTGKVTFIESINNVTVNDEHPELISYGYENNGQLFTDKFETFDLEKTAELEKGTDVKILVYQKESIIKGLEPYSFPFYVLGVLPAIFLIVGTILLLTGLIPALRVFDLYKTGVERDGYVVSMSIKTSLFKTNTSQKVLVNYYYQDAFKNNIYGESITSDMLVLNEKKTGDMIKIFVSEKDETRSCLIPKLEAMKYNWGVKFNN